MSLPQQLLDELGIDRPPTLGSLRGHDELLDLARPAVRPVAGLKLLQHVPQLLKEPDGGAWAVRAAGRALEAR